MYYACHAKRTRQHWYASKALRLPRKTQTTSTQVAKRNISILFARKSTSRTSSWRQFSRTAHGHGFATSLRTVANTKTTLSEHDSNLKPRLEVAPPAEDRVTFKFNKYLGADTGIWSLTTFFNGRFVCVGGTGVFVSGLDLWNYVKF